MKVSRFSFNMFGVNTYILWDDISKEAIIIDPGMINDNERKIIDNFIESNNLTLTHLVNTHMHIDHSFGVPYIIQKYNLQLKCNENDQFLAGRLKDQADMFGLPIAVEDLTITVNLKDGDIISIGSEDLHILQVPGHSPGSIVLYAPKSGFIISGDVLFFSSVGRSDLPGGNHTQLIKGIHDKLLTLDSDTIVYPGHGPETTIGQEKVNNPYL